MHPDVSIGQTQIVYKGKGFQFGREGKSVFFTEEKMELYLI